MRVPREIDELLKEGTSLSAHEAEALERDLEQRPDDLAARGRLLGYYQACRKDASKATTMQGKISFMRGTTSEREALARHAVWLAANAPRAPLASHPLVQFSTHESVYAELSSIWRRQLAADPPDPTVFANAIAFFWWPNDIFADELLVRAEELFPGDRRWLAFRRRRRAHELSLAFRFQRLSAGGLARGDDLEARGAEGPTEQGLAEIEQLLREGDPDSDWIPELREVAGQLSFALGRIEKARAHAEQMLVSTICEPGGGYDDAVHNGHLLLGRIALRENDIERARAHLILAGRAGATGMVPIFGPDMRLSAELLARGEGDVVVRYLSHCRSFWERGPVDEWIAEIRAGSIPQFGRNLER
jgi:hypothetical protein